jgi:hypothetical protein
VNITDYMDRPEELRKYAGICEANGFAVPPNGARGLCVLMANGDSNVFKLMWSTWNFENAFDDLIDQEGIEENVKLCAMAALHDAIVEVLNISQGAAYSRLLQVCAHLERRTKWHQSRKTMAYCAIQQFFVELASNPFARSNAEQLKAMLVQAILRCLSGDLMARSEDPRKRELAPAVRCGDVDLFMHMIYLARGFAAASAWCGKLGYDLPDGDGDTKQKN